MAPAPPSEEPFKVLITGFGPFRDITDNPSWLAVHPLDGAVLTSPPSSLSSPAFSSTSKPSSSKSARAISISSQLVQVTWADVLRTVPLLHKQPESTRPDLIIHVGVGGRNSLTLEQRGRRYGYEKQLDATGMRAPERDGVFGFVGDEWSGEPQERRTVVKGQVVKDWVAERGLTQLRLSEDAGLYLCEFISFCSLSNSARSGIPVQFIHVPPLGAPFSAKELTHAIKLLIWAIVNEGGLP